MIYWDFPQRAIRVIFQIIQYGKGLFLIKI